MTGDNDGIDVKVKSYATACLKCVRLSLDGVKSRSAGLLRDGMIHAIAIDGDAEALCDGYSDWNAVITP